MARSRTSLRLLAAIGLLSLLPLGGWWSWRREGPARQETVVLVPKGTTVDQMADRLAAAGVIRSPRLFRLWARARRLQLLRGEYAFRAGASLSEVAGKLRRGDIHYTQVTIPVGAHAWVVQRRLRAFVPEEVFWTLWRSPRLAAAAGFPEAPSLEGLVAPATYRLHHALEPAEILLQMTEAFHEQVLPRLQGGVLDPYRTLVLASLAERETRVPEELPRVAGVYHHRLSIGMRLQCDPTAQYARWLSGDLRFTAPDPSDLRRDHPFNTYLVKGLPPTPIAIPGSAAIEAAKAPLDGRDLYFVATGRGGHAFSETLDAHNRHVGAFRKEVARQRRERRG